MPLFPLDTPWNELNEIHVVLTQNSQTTLKDKRTFEIAVIRQVRCDIVIKPPMAVKIANRLEEACSLHPECFQVFDDMNRQIDPRTGQLIPESPDSESPHYEPDYPAP